jgi:curved DNA-binding protein CbpA
MSDPYTVLGIAGDATDEAVRQRYLELARQFAPEHHPERFAAIRAAYEKVKTTEARARYRLLGAGAEDTIDAIIEEVQCRTPRQRIGLDKLLKAANPAGR